MASIKDVARVANVSTATVSHVINETRYVSEETKLKVFQAMKELDYKPNLIAKSLRSRKSMIIGLIVPMQYADTSNFFFMSIANGIEKIVKEKGYNLILGNSHENIETEMEQIKLFNSQLIDGLIIAPAADHYSQYEEHLTGDYPVVFIDRKPKDFSGDLVMADSHQGTFDAIHSLVQKGHKRIGFITGYLGISTSDDRLTAYKRAYMQNNLTVDPLLMAEGPPSFDEGYRLAEKLIKERKATAIFAANNVMTMGALSFINESNLKVPEDIAVIGFDDYDWMRITNPPLSVVQQPSFEMGEHAVRILLDKIDNKIIEEEQVILPTKYVSRQSV
ncbi:LacI family DNA-binding transcriptional regulator [Gracilibacillus sp. YIM 98692]|uniref:LacI family DNA-binding transcriptional regulator n=1 Tax=Gracilibacillus sp. YIM 98692 TaxID=2663532 RepID=UPI0013D416E9|nr:LacI family DNA-binding transcriptional regulator [Gracilibacillus sp. YIM 98692]